MSLEVLEPPTLLELLDKEIEATIQGLNKKKFQPDPIAGRTFSRVVSVTSSAYKRHGNIIEKAILAQLAARPELTVWSDKKFQVLKAADLIVNLGSKNLSDINESDLDYGESGRTLQIDAIVYHKEARTLRAYEIKRGFGTHDSQKKKDMIHNALCVRSAIEILWPVEGPRSHVSRQPYNFLLCHKFRSAPANWDYRQRVGCAFRLPG